MSANDVFNKDNLENYLKELSKEFKKLNGNKMPAEIVLIGGAAVLLRYNFRNSTDDVDAIIRSTSVMKEAINITAQKYNLPNGWLNADFKNTESYSDNLLGIAKHYKTLSNILDIRVIDSEYLVAMKLKSGRGYKNDLSDVPGIIWEHEKQGKSLKYEDIKKAFEYLYEDWEKMPRKSMALINDIYNKGNVEKIYYESKKEEEEARELLGEFKQEYPNVITRGNINEILENLQNKEKDAPQLSSSASVTIINEVDKTYKR